MLLDLLLPQSGLNTLVNFTKKKIRVPEKRSDSIFGHVEAQKSRMAYAPKLSYLFLSWRYLGVFLGNVPLSLHIWGS